MFALQTLVRTTCTIDIWKLSVSQRSQGLEKGADRLKNLVLYAVDEGFGGKVRISA